MAGTIHQETLFSAQSGLGTKGDRAGLADARHVRVYADWAAGVTAGVVTIRHRPRSGSGGYEDAGTLSFTAGKANSLRVEGPVDQVEVEITTAVVGGTVSVYLLANG